MARITGKNGTIKVGSTVVADITDWVLDAKLPTVDASAMGDDWASKLSLIREWGGSLKAVYGNAAEQALLLAGYFAATAASGATGGSVELHLMPDSADEEDFYGTAYLDFSVNSDKSKPNEVSYKFTGTGALTHTPNS